MIRELCRLHNCPLPPDLDNLTLQYPTRPSVAERLDGQQQQRGHGNNNNSHIVDVESDGEEDLENLESDDQEGSDVEEDLPLEMDDGKNTNKVSGWDILPAAI